MKRLLTTGDTMDEVMKARRASVPNSSSPTYVGADTGHLPLPLARRHQLDRLETAEADLQEMLDAGKVARRELAAAQVEADRLEALIATARLEVAKQRELAAWRLGIVKISDPA